MSDATDAAALLLAKKVGLREQSSVRLRVQNDDTEDDDDDDKEEEEEAAKGVSVSFDLFFLKRERENFQTDTPKNFCWEIPRERENREKFLEKRKKASPRHESKDAQRKKENVNESAPERLTRP